MAALRYWDTVCFLGWLNFEDDKVDKCEGVLQAAERGEVKIVTSALTLVEVIKLKTHPPLDRSQQKTIENFFRRSYISVRDVDPYIATLARGLIWDHNVQPKDAIHIATARKLKVPVFDTFDGELIKKFDNHFDDPPLRVGNPNIPFQINMFTHSEE